MTLNYTGEVPWHNLNLRIVSRRFTASLVQYSALHQTTFQPFLYEIIFDAKVTGQERVKY